MSDIVTEGSTAYLTVNFKDKDDALEAPNSAIYRIDCMTNGQEIKGNTAISPIASSVEVEIAASENAIIDQTKTTEKRLVTVMASYGDDDAVNDNFIFHVINLSKVPSA